MKLQSYCRKKPECSRCVTLDGVLLERLCRLVLHVAVSRSHLKVLTGSNQATQESHIDIHWKWDGEAEGKSSNRSSSSGTNVWRFTQDEFRIKISQGHVLIRVV